MRALHYGCLPSRWGSAFNLFEMEVRQDNPDHSCLRTACFGSASHGQAIGRSGIKRMTEKLQKVIITETSGIYAWSSTISRASSMARVATSAASPVIGTREAADTSTVSSASTIRLGSRIRLSRSPRIISPRRSLCAFTSARSCATCSSNSLISVIHSLIETVGSLSVGGNVSCPVSTPL